MLDSLKIALVCDWLTVYAGAERVVLAMHELFPKAPIYTTLYDADKCKAFKDAEVRTSGLQKIPGAKKMHRLFFPLMPGVFERMDLDEFDIVLSSSHAAAKGIITKPGTLHLSYCHSPTRYLWDHSHEYQREFRKFTPLRPIYKPILHHLRQWDRIASERVDHYIANSEFVRQRIKKYYKRESEIIHPPVDLSFFDHSEGERESYLAVGRLIPYKRFDIVIEACEKMGRPIRIIGEGPDLKRLKSIAGKNTSFLGHVSPEQLRSEYQKAKALLFPQTEDFGIVPLEAMACGTPVIAFGRGGALETIQNEESGLFFESQNALELQAKIEEFESKTWSSKLISKSVQNFSTPRFKSELRHCMEKAWKAHQNMLA
jgi:glycosyltransferase involved in cell wall biosynthesis